MNNSLFSLLEQLVHRQTSLSKEEQAHLELDLRLMHNFLDAKEYQHTALWHRQQLCVQKKNHEYLGYIHGCYQQAMEWKNFLQSLPIENISTLLDIGPGFSPKIEIALKKLQYHGQLTILDCTDNEFEKLQSYLNLFDIDYEVVFVKDNLISLKAERFDMIVTNHFLDDYLLNEYCKIEAQCIQSIYSNENYFKEATQQIIHRMDYKLFVMQLVHAFLRLTKHQGFLVIRHYQSLTEKILELNDWVYFLDKFFLEMVHELQNEGFKLLKQQDGFIAFQLTQVHS